MVVVLVWHYYLVYELAGSVHLAEYVKCAVNQKMFQK